MTLPASGALTLENIQTEFGGTSPIGLGEYYAGGGLVPAGTSGTYGAVPSSGALSVQNFYGTSNYTPVYIEELFSTYLHTGNYAAQTITNEIDLAGKGGMVWLKQRSDPYGSGLSSHYLADTVRGATKVMYVNTPNPSQTLTNSVTSFNSNGFNIGQDGSINFYTGKYASWTFRKQPKFFDIVTWTGDDTNNRQISTALGSVPGCVITKCTSHNESWLVFHRNDGSSKKLLELNGTQIAYSDYGNGVIYTSSSSITVNNSQFMMGTGTVGSLNMAGKIYIAYIFAHDAGGFGLTGSDSVISCGSFTTDGSGVASVNLGYEPQWVLTKSVTGSTGNWLIHDTIRDLPVGRPGGTLYANANNDENNFQQGLTLTATGFSTIQDTGYLYNTNYIYIAIRRGPMKVPTDATKVFSPQYMNNGGPATINFPLDLQITRRPGQADYWGWADRLRGLNTNTTYYASYALFSDQSMAESTMLGQINRYVRNTGYDAPGAYTEAQTSTLNFRRATGFFDIVCWTGNGGLDQVVTHNLGVIPTMLITKQRNSSNSWATIVNTGSGTYPCRQLYLNDSSGSTASFGNQSTATTCIPMAATGWGATYVTYLFATCPGVSKVGSYTGTGTLQQINCGFAAGARFILIKRTDSTGDWYVWDSARGITSGNDPYLLLNSTAYNETSTDYIDPYSAGFEISSTAPAAINASGGSYIYLAIA